MRQTANLGAAVQAGDKTAIRRVRKLAKGGSKGAGRILAAAGVKGAK